MTPERARAITKELKMRCPKQFYELTKATGVSREMLIGTLISVVTGDGSVSETTKQALRQRANEFRQFAKALPGWSVCAGPKGWEARKIECNSGAGSPKRYGEIGVLLRQQKSPHNKIALALHKLPKRNGEKDPPWEPLSTLIAATYIVTGVKEPADTRKITADSLRKFVNRNKMESGT